jgi:hypothetical protein
MDAVRLYFGMFNNSFLGEVRNGDDRSYLADQAWQQSGIPERELTIEPLRMIQSGSIMDGNDLARDPEWSRVARTPQQPMFQLSREIELFPQVSLNSQQRSGRFHRA